MASQPPTGPQHFMPPSARELRAQAVQRLQTGLFGLAVIVLVIGLANIINDRARLGEAQQPPAPAQSAAAPANADPLADAGVVPSTNNDPAPSPTPGASPSAAPR